MQNIVGVLLSKSVAQTFKRYLLPFSVLSEKRKASFTEDLELATLFCLAEAERSKGGGLVTRQPEEQLEFIAKIGYPLWFVSWNNTVLVFDGLGRSNHTVSYSSLPDVKAFVDNFRRSAKTRETHLAFLRDHLGYFETSDPEKSLQVSGLIKGDEFLSELAIYSAEAVPIEDGNVRVGLITQTFDESAFLLETQELENLLSSFKRDVALLRKCMKLINQATNHHLRVLRKRIRVVKDEFAVRLKREEEKVCPKIGVLKDDYAARVSETARNFRRQRLPFQKEKVRLEKARERASERIEKCKMEARAYAEKEDKMSEKKWKEKGDRLKKELSEVEKHHETIEKELKDLEERRSLEFFKLREELEARVKEASQSLLELESSRDAKVLIYKQEMEWLEKQTELLSDMIGAVVKLRETDIANLGTLGTKKGVVSGEYALYYVPFYFASYLADMKKRDFIVPPSIVNTIGIATKLKSALGMAKVKHLLQSRFMVAAFLMDTILLLVKENASFEAEIEEMGQKNNILGLGNFVERIKNGISCLKEEGWLSEKETESIIQKLGQL